MNKYLLIACLIMATALIFMCYKSCSSKAIVKDQQNITTQVRQKDSLLKSKDSALNRYDNQKDSLTREAVTWHFKYDSLINDQVHIRGLITARERIIQSLLYALDSASKANDTLQQLRSCGELQTEIQSYVNLVGQLEDKIDTSEEYCSRQLDLKDSIISNQEKQMDVWKKSYDDLTTEYNGAIATQKKFLRKAKLSDLVTKISTIAAGVLAIITVIKK